MIKFFIILIFYLIGSLVIFFYFDIPKNQKLLCKGGRIEGWSEKKQKITTLIVNLCFKVLALSALIFLVIPMFRDIPYALNNDYQVIQGKASEVSGASVGWYIKQHFTIGSIQFFYYLPGKRCKENKEYNVKYLPHSKFVMSVKEIK